VKSDYYLRHVCVSVRMEQLSSHWTDFHEIWNLRMLPKPNTNIEVSLKSEKNKEYFRCIFIITSRKILLKIRIFFRQKLQRKSKHTFKFNNLFRKSCRLWVNVGKYFRAGQATDDNTAHALCMLDT
jgi:hypothetical protein